jgi:ABC-2 type transport system ATP-binding protein
VFALETTSLTKYYSRGKIHALEDFSLEVTPGQIFSLLGPNGAGKTTLIKLLIGIVSPTRGSAQILDRPITDYRMHSRLGYLAENHRFPDFLNAEQVLFYYGKMNGMSAVDLRKKIPALLKRVKLEEWISVKIRKFSKGMLQRLGLAHALLHDPDLLFLDEPTDGIDPVGRREIRDLLKELRNQGKTIFLNSHLLSEVERVSDQIAILQNGKLIRQGSVSDFTSVENQYQLTVHSRSEKIATICADLKIPVSSHQDVFTVRVKDEKQLNIFIDHLRQADILITSVTPRKISLEDFFIDVLDEEQGAKN